MGDKMEHTFGCKVKEARERLNLTQDEAAQTIRNKYGVRLSSAYLSMIERNERTNITTKLDEALRDFFSIPRETIFLKDKKPKELIKILEQEDFILNGRMATQEDRERLIRMYEAMFWDAKEKNRRK